MSIKDYLRGWKATFIWAYPSLVSFIPSRSIRRLLFNAVGGGINSSVSMFRSVKIRNPKGLRIGEHSSIGPQVLLDARCGLEIGKCVTVAYDAVIWTLHHDMNSPTFDGKGGKVTIDDYAWLCSRCIILPGVKIGKGAVVASGAVVSKDVEPFTIVGGIPAKVIGQRENKDYTYKPNFDIHIF